MSLLNQDDVKTIKQLSEKLLQYETQISQLEF